jgi:hypothetical protein
MRAYLTFPSLLALTLLGLAPRLAHAEGSCSANSDCVKGWSCEVTGGSDCATPACPPDEKCEPQPSDCTHVEYKSCQPGPCQADSDCADGMVCYRYTESCPSIACAPGEACPEPACAAKTASACVPRYVLPCTTASDCGTGFQCESAGETCTCSGSAPSSGSGGSAPLPPPEPTCTCESSDAKQCHAATINCTADSDCLAGWTCAVVASSSDCASSPASNPVPGAGAQGGATPAPDCRPSADVKQCVPPYYGLLQGARGVSHDSTGSPTLVAGEGNSSGVIPPKADDGSNRDASSSAGCSVTRGAGTGSSAALLAALGLASALRRRRPR